MAEDTHTTRKGVVIKLCLYSPVLRDKVRASVTYPSVPIYEAKTAGGGIEKHPYTEDMIETPDEREMWRQYQGEKLAVDLLLYSRLGQLALARGTEVEIPTGWERSQEKLGIEIPTDPEDRKVHFLETEAVESNDELSALILAILQYQSATEEERAAAAASFQSPVAGDTTSGTKSEQGAMASE